VRELKAKCPGTMSGSPVVCQMTGAWRVALLASVSALFVMGQIDVADAQFFRPQPRQDIPSRDIPPRPDTKARKANRTTAAKSKKDVPIRQPFGENMPKGPLQLMISINEQRAVLYSNGIRVAETKVSTGTPGHPTPTGVFSIIQKNRWHRSNLYGDAPMFYMHRLTWSGIALHEGHLPGHAASHGCIRMPTDFVSRLWNVSKLGMRVVVARPQLTPQEFTHAKLFNPAQKPIDTQRTSELPDGLRPSLETTGQGIVQFAQAETIATDAAPAPISAGTPVTLDSAIRQGVAAAAAEMSTPSTSATADVVATPAPAAVTEPVTTATVPALAEGAPTAPAATPAATTNEPARPAVDTNEPPRPAPLRARTAEPAKLNGQVAVFISGKEKRIYIRHAFVPVFDMPIEIANPGKPLGTHTFTALEAVDGGTRMRWNVVSMPLTAGQHAAAPSKKGAAQQPPQRPKSVRGAVVTSDSSNATDALDRVTIPQQALDRIAELLTPGSSLIISDDGLGRETGRYTEFIVETR
jgi:lipoprotein-anchoring transpeptidase ErfK/SrfK